MMLGSSSSSNVPLCKTLCAETLVAIIASVSPEINVELLFNRRPATSLSSQVRLICQGDASDPANLAPGINRWLDRIPANFSFVIFILYSWFILLATPLTSTNSSSKIS